MILRAERPSDRDMIRAVHLAAFPSQDEANLVDALRRDGDAAVSLVALENGQVTGHVLFSRMVEPACALGLAPVAVLPAFRRRGVGASLIEAGLAQASGQGWELVFVVGNPAYYRRFGFDTALARGFTSLYAGDHFMARALVTTAARGGKAEYAPAFSGLG
ncbi:MAG TPA: N-acetyltransferase [Rhizomicrobium sp.]|nr:N-acetyltransferase [Rhizomicrobium sp.]